MLLEGLEVVFIVITFGGNATRKPRSLPVRWRRDAVVVVTVSLDLVRAPLAKCRRTR